MDRERDKLWMGGLMNLVAVVDAIYGSLSCRVNTISFQCQVPLVGREFLNLLAHNSTCARDTVSPQVILILLMGTASTSTWHHANRISGCCRNVMILLNSVFVALLNCGVVKCTTLIQSNGKGEPALCDNESLLRNEWGSGGDDKLCALPSLVIIIL